MVIVRLDGGLGNQIDQYAVSRCLAHKLNTELKLDLSIAHISNELKPIYHGNYRLETFNILENFATSEEIERVRKNGVTLGSLQDFQALKPNLENFKGDILVRGHWLHNPALYRDIEDILIKELTPKRKLHTNSETWRKKIISAECPVALHFRQGDFAYHPFRRLTWFPILPLDYYYNSIDILKQRYNNLTAFVFSNNLQWLKENLHLDIPTEFVEGCETDNEEFILISLCKHSIINGSSFSARASWLNRNPDKKIFYPKKSNAEGVQQFLKELTPSKKDALLNSVNIFVPTDYDNQPEITQRPYFSLLLVVNNDAETISETLDSILSQDYKYYEVVIIDNASTDGSGKICQEAIKGRENVTFKKLWTKVKNAEAWNMALNMTNGGGYYVSFLKGNDRFMANTLPTLYIKNEFIMAEIIHLFTWLRQNDDSIVKYYRQRDDHFQNEYREITGSNNGQETVKLLLDDQINRFLGTKIYHRAFLSNNGIKFDEYLDDDEAELSFQMQCFLKSKHIMYANIACYIAPKNFQEQCPGAKFHDVSNEDAQIVRKFRPYFTARVDIKLLTTTGDFQILYMSDERADVLKPGWFQKGGIGYQIQSYAGRLAFAVRATVAGKIQLLLRGIDIRVPGDGSKRIPYWIDYTKLTIKSRTIFDKITPAWHDKPYSYTMDVKAGEEINLYIGWLPHRGDT